MKLLRILLPLLFASVAHGACPSHFAAGDTNYISKLNLLIDCVVAGGGAPVTTKGDLYGYSSVGARVPVGSNNQILVPDSAQTLGLKWTTTLPAAAFPALTGDVTTSGGAVATTLATVNGNVGTFGTASTVPVITANGKGLVTALSTLVMTPDIFNVTGLGTGVKTALGVNVGSAGAPVLLNGAGGTPSALVCTNCTGTASGLTAGTVTTNANLTGDVTSSGNATTLASSVIATIRTLPQNSQSTAYTTVLTDCGKHILHPSADTTARIITIDSNANVAAPIGCMITVVNQNAAGVLTVKVTADTQRLAGPGTTGDRTMAANCVATWLKIVATEWIVSGGTCLT